MNNLHIGGITPFSTLDYPDNLSAVFFFQGCVFKCPYCHNKEFQQVKKPTYSLEEFKSFLDERAGFLDAIVFSGGEPLMFIDELELLCGYSKEKGFKVGLHTTGYSPDRLKKLIDGKMLDWVGIDLKADRESYPFATGTEKNFFPETIQSIKLLKKSKIDFEVRTTVYREIANIESLKKIVDCYGDLEIYNPVFQVFSVEGKPDRDIELFLKTFKSQNNVEYIIRA